MYSKFHRIPRICFYALTKGATDAYLQEIQSAINNIGSIETFIHSTSGPMPFPDKTSSKLVRIEPVDHAWRTTSTMLLSDYITKRILERISLYRMINASQSIKNLLSDPNSRGHGGKLFEQAVHRKFCAGFQFFPDKPTLDAPQLEINIIGFDNEADGYFHCLEVRSAKGSRAINKYVQRYLVPISKTKESVDSVWLSTGCTVFFQVTVNPDHGLKGHGITELVDEPPGDAKKNVYVVFVVPLDGERTKSFKHQKITFRPEHLRQRLISWKGIINTFISLISTAWHPQNRSDVHPEMMTIVQRLILNLSSRSTCTCTLLPRNDCPATATPHWSRTL
jgi:hypothetical protein